MRKLTLLVAAVAVLGLSGRPASAQGVSATPIVDLCRSFAEECPNPQFFGLCVAFYTMCEDPADSTTACGRVFLRLYYECFLSCEEGIEQLCVAPWPSVYGKCEAAVNACGINQYTRPGGEALCLKASAAFEAACNP